MFFLPRWYNPGRTDIRTIAMTIRNMLPTDWEQVKDIYTEGILSGRSTFTTEAPEYPEWDSAHLARCRFVAEIDGNVAGWVAVSPTSSREAYRGVVELSIYVGKKHHRRGVGTALLQRLMEECPKEDIWSLFSVVIAINEASIALHEKMGFRKIGYKDRPARDRFGQWQNTILFEKRL